jgi:alkanesulfonate monooxygenase SsuD/methylene tetrahydromethanopterin reductase-like flavin-dependent oxidoreductase (luciferase family)
MEAGVHLPQLALASEGLSYRRLADTVDAARECGFVAVSANDHFFFGAPWLDALTVLAASVERAGEMALTTTVSLPTLRGPVPTASALLALHALTGGRVVAGLGPGSSRQDHDSVGVAFEERWPRFEEAVGLLRALLSGETPTSGGRYYPVPQARMSPLPAGSGAIPLWIGSWGSAAGLRRVARLADGWLASAYNTSPAGFAAGLDLLRGELRKNGRQSEAFPHALVTMWTWITEDRREAEQIIGDRLAPLLHTEPSVLKGRLCVGPAQMCAELLSEYARAGCRRVHFWPVGDDRRQIELLATEVLPQVGT